MIEEVMLQSYSSSEVDSTQKSFEFTNYDGSVKIARDLAKITSINEEYQKEGIRLFNEYLESRIVPEDVSAIIKAVIEFPSVQIINVLTRMTETIEDPLFITAVEMFRGSIQDADTKSYTRVYIQVDGKYILVNLSISKI